MSRATDARDPVRFTPGRLRSLQAWRLERFNWRTLITAQGGTPLAVAVALDGYFRRFAQPSGACLNCGARLWGTEVEMALGLTHTEWGLANGETRCSRCGYPGRAYHRNVGLIQFINLNLQYHPDLLWWPEEDVAARSRPGSRT